MSPAQEDTGRQLPAGGEAYLDHVGWFAPDLAGATACFERLGFTLTPYSIHGDRDPRTGAVNPVGTANRNAMLRAGYLELLCPHGTAATPARLHLDARLARRPGVHLLAFAVADAAAYATTLAARGFDLMPTVNLRRRIEAAEGGEAEVAFTVVRPRLDTFPEGRVQVLTHHTPRHMWQQRYVAHANGVTALAGVVIASPTPRESAERIARLTGAAPTGGPDAILIALGRGRVEVLTPRAARDRLGAPLPAPDAEPHIAAVALAVRSLAATRDVLAGRGVAVRRHADGALLIDAADAGGTPLIAREPHRSIG